MLGGARGFTVAFKLVSSENKISKRGQNSGSSGYLANSPPNLSLCDGQNAISCKIRSSATVK